MHRRFHTVAAALALLATPLAAQQVRSARLALSEGPPPAAFPQDPADALYRQGRESLNRSDWLGAARRFQQIRQRYPRSRYTPDALYWEAYARYRTGRAEQYRLALGGLDTQRRDYPNAGTRDDANSLRLRIQGELARQGDPQAAENVAGAARTAVQQCGRRGGDDDERLAALNALLQMDADQAMPLLRTVLARRDDCSEELRSRAVFLVAQKAGGDAENMLLDVARNDPSSEVRGQAVFWLSQSGTERSLDAIEQILRTTRDTEVQEKAIFAVSQHRSPRAAQLLRAYAERDDVSTEIREKAIFFLGQRGSENAAYLRTLFGRLRDEDLKNKVLFSLSQMRGAGNDRWILNVALDSNQPVEIRRQALFWAGQAGVALPEIISLYDRIREREMREQVIFVLSQRMREPASLDKLIDIARRDPDRELRQKAIFWLGQSRDPRATRLLQELIGA